MKNGKKRLFLRLFVHHRARLGVSSIISYYVNFSVALAEAVDMTKGIIRRCIYAVYSTTRERVPRNSILSLWVPSLLSNISKPQFELFSCWNHWRYLVSICRWSL